MEKSKRKNQVWDSDGNLQYYTIVLYYTCHLRMLVLSCCKERTVLWCPLDWLTRQLVMAISLPVHIYP
jgi:hypothetical protein